MLSPGVYVHEEDRSQVVASSSSSVGVFAGDFVKGPIGAYKLINTLEELEAKLRKDEKLGSVAQQKVLLIIKRKRVIFNNF